ncbi:unnamed protein product [Cuscuta epithymum]|uniref:Non-structural maintenance of chromosomes element 4 n=1 Tax=Cuscuta epithymum TaxID=186058 RepID=A0AAV0FGX3_9ASTE|nr:unnamed protein product [Cuscuta epithymum]
MDGAEAVARRIDRLELINEFTQFVQQPDGDRRKIRSQYYTHQNTINERSEDIGNSEPEKFNEMFVNVNGLFQYVTRPREQVADAETVLGLTSSLVDSVKSHLKGNVTPSGFVYHLLKHYGRRGGRGKNAGPILRWEEIALPFLKDGSGCKTMVGPMSYKIKLEPVYCMIKPDTLNYVIKHRGIRNEIKKTRCTPYVRPVKLLDSTAEWKSNTEANVSSMFEAIKEKKCVKLENLVLNRISYAQTIENIFVLSFLVNDGRIAIRLAENGSYIVSTSDAAAACVVLPTNEPYQNSIFRFDYIDWKVMLDLVPDGEELMPHRDPFKLS